MANLLDKAKNFVVDKIANIEKPEASLSDVDLKSVTRESVVYKAEVNVKNPYGHPIPICEIAFNLKSAGREIASGTIPDPGSLKAKDTTLLEVPVKCPYSILVSLAKDIGRDWDIDYQLDVVLTIDHGLCRKRLDYGSRVGIGFRLRPVGFRGLVRIRGGSERRRNFRLLDLRDFLSQWNLRFSVWRLGLEVWRGGRGKGRGRGRADEGDGIEG